MKKSISRHLGPVLCILGTGATAWGMIRSDHPIFLIGIAGLVAGYLLIRKRIKRSLEKD